MSVPNKIPRYLTNKSNGFENNFLNLGIQVEPPTKKTLSAELSNTMNLLNLNSDSDYFMHGILAAIHSYPEIVRNLNASLNWYKLEWFKQSDYTIDNASVVAPPGSYVQIKSDPNYWTPDFTYTVSYKDSQTAIITNNGNSWVVSWRDISDNTVYPDGDYILFDFTSSPLKNVKGYFLSKEPWSSSHSFSITLPPPSYPYNYVANELTVSSRYVSNLIQDTGYASAFFASPYAFEKVALLGAAIITKLEKEIVS